MSRDPRAAMPRPGGPVASVFHGVLLLGRGRAEGLDCFGVTRDALLAALAPYLALIGVGAFILITRQGAAIDVVRLLLLLCQVLVHPVLTQFLARRWNREGLWLRFATASLWASWLVQALILLGFFLLHALAPDLAASASVGLGLMLAFQAYNLWLGWFIARVGLIIGPLRAVVFVAVTIGAVIALYALASALPPHFDALGDLLAPPY